MYNLYNATYTTTLTSQTCLIENIMFLFCFVARIQWTSVNFYIFFQYLECRYCYSDYRTAWNSFNHCQKTLKLSTTTRKCKLQNIKFQKPLNFYVPLKVIFVTSTIFMTIHGFLKINWSSLNANVCWNNSFLNCLKSSKVQLKNLSLYKKSIVCVA